MKETVSVAQAAIAQEAVLPARVQEALGELVGAAKEGLLALSVAVGLGVLAELLEEEVDEVVGPKGTRTTRTGPRCAMATRPARSRSAGGGSRSSAAGADRRRRARGAAGDLRALRRPRPADPGRCSSGCSPASRRAASRARASRSASEVVGAERSTSKSAVSREFVGRTSEHLASSDARPLRGHPPGGADARRRSS